MRTILAGVVLLAGIVVLEGCASTGYMQHRVRPNSARDSAAALSTHDIIAMSDAGVSDSTIIRMLDASGEQFRLTSRDVIALSDSGVSENVINAMMAPRDNGRTDEGYSYGPEYYPYYYYYPYASYWGFPYYYSPWYFGLRFGYHYPHYRGHSYYGHSGWGAPHGPAGAGHSSGGAGRQNPSGGRPMGKRR